MKSISLIIITLLVFASCKKEDPAVVDVPTSYTSDMPDSFETFISVDYDQNDNETKVKVFFRGEPNSTTYRLLKLPSNSTIKYNGTVLTGEYTFEKTIEGKENAQFDFLNFDETLYTNSITAPDTVFFKDLPDTVSSDLDLTVSFGGESLENNEKWSFAFPGNFYGDYYDGVFTTTTDTSVFVDKQILLPSTTYPVELTKVITLEHPELPLGGGRIIYRYKITKEIYSE